MMIGVGGNLEKAGIPYAAKCRTCPNDAYVKGLRWRCPIDACNFDACIKCIPLPVPFPLLNFCLSPFRTVHLILPKFLKFVMSLLKLCLWNHLVQLHR
jgi:hypothetical protein